MGALLVEAFFDASRDSRSEHAVTVAGVVGSADEMDVLRTNWRRIRRQFGIGTFHMTDLMARRPPFDAWPPGRTDDLLLALVDCILAQPRFLPSTSVPNREWDSADQVTCLTETGCLPYTLAAITVTHKMVEWVGANYPRHVVMQPKFEHGDVGASEFARFMTHVTEASGGTLSVLEPSFVRKGDPVLEVCDLLSWEQRHVVEVRSKGFEIEYRMSRERLAEKNAQHWGVLFRDAIVDWARNYEVPQRTEPLPTAELRAWRPVFKVPPAKQRPV